MKPKNEKIIITSVQEFIESILQESESGALHLYRGQYDERWNLNASIFREIYNENKELKIYQIIKKYNFQEFSNQQLFLNELIQMQHYGVPTRLLDWTYNPLMALYFAVEHGINIDGEVILKIINQNDIYNFNSEKFQLLSEVFEKDAQLTVLSFSDKVKSLLTDAILDKKNTYFIDPIFSNARIKAQQGCFSVTIDKKNKFVYTVLDDLLLNIVRTFITKKQDQATILKNIDNNNIKALISELVKVYKQQNYNDIEERFKKYIHNLIKNAKMIVQGTENLHNDFQRFFTQEVNKFRQDNYGIAKESLIIYKIKKEYKTKIKQQLNALGITPMMIYPDLKGSINYINELFGN